MIEILVLWWLCRKNSQAAENNGRSPTLHVFITIILWFGLEVVGVLIGLSFGLEYVAYLLGIVFAAIGGFISHAIASHSSYEYTPRRHYTIPSEYAPGGGFQPPSNYTPGGNYQQQSSYQPRGNEPPEDYFPPTAGVRPANHAQITVARERSNQRSPGDWEFFLNGDNVGRVEDGSSITVPTGHRYNVLIARDNHGTLSPPFEFSVESGRHSKVIFREGRFVKVKKIGRMS